MQRLFFICLLSFVLSSGFSQNANYLRYIENYSEIAIREMDRAGIPASIKLAQGILESGAGKSYLAREGNNHFGIKCHSNWRGKKIWRKDDDRDEKGKLIKSCFRSYRSVEDSYIAHSEFLRDPNKNKRYGFLFQINPLDYKRWAYGLKQSGYATSPTYAQKLINIIETYELYRFDEMSVTDVLVNTGQKTQGYFTNNDVNLVLASTGDTPASIARSVNIQVKKILKYNEMISNANQSLNDREKVYIQKKRKSFRGRKKWHYVKKGETMYSISQDYGIQLKRLYRRNRLDYGTQPAVGEKVKIRGLLNVSPTERPLLTTDLPPTRVNPNVEIPEEDEFIDMGEEKEDIPPAPKPIKEQKPVVVPSEKPDDKIPAIEDEPIKITPSKPIPPKEIIKEEKPEIITPVETKPEVIEVPKPDPKPQPPVKIEPTIVEEKPQVTPEPTPIPTPELTFHTVQKGDTLYNISKRYGLSVPQLKRLNGLTNNNIRIGQKLKVK